MSFRFNRNSNGNVIFYTIPQFESTNLVKHFFTSRHGGTSEGDFYSLNLGMNTNDNISNVKINYQIVADTLDTDINNFVLSDQVHKCNIKIVNENDRGKGIVKERDYKEIDGLITNNKNIVLSTVYADCVPIFYLDVVKKVIALAHAGWRGTVNKIAGKIIDEMVINFESNPKDIYVGIGPSIGSCCYEVDENVITKFKKNFNNSNDFIKKTSKNKWALDLWHANYSLLLEKGVLKNNITCSGLCTSCNVDSFFSYRKENGNTGRMGAFIMLK